MEKLPWQFKGMAEIRFICLPFCGGGGGGVGGVGVGGGGGGGVDCGSGIVPRRVISSDKEKNRFLWVR